MLRRLICNLFSHRYVRMQKLSPRADRIKCLRCGSDDAIHYDLRCVVPYAEVRELYERTL